MFTADHLEITVLVENWVDMLLPDLGQEDAKSMHCVSRAGLIHHFDPKLVPPQAENGLSLLVTATRGRHSTTVLFDVGLTGAVLLHNLGALGVDPGTVDHVVVSHGHPDHYGGIHHLLSALDRPVPVATHQDAFLPRYAVMGDGRTAPFYNAAFNPDEIAKNGGRPVLTREPIDLGWGIATTGEIPRTVSFEGPRETQFGAPGLYQVDDRGGFRTDEVWDEQALVVDVANEGLVVLTGCAHAGVINTIRRARELFDDRPVRAVMGGFHLGFPTTPSENVDKTCEALAELEVRTIMPMHCSGVRAHAALLQEHPESYVQPSVGTRLRFG